MYTKRNSLHRDLRLLSIAVFYIATSIVLLSGCQSHTNSSYIHRDIGDREWLEMVKKVEHQPVTIWMGSGVSTIEQNQFGISFNGLSYRNTPANVLEYHLSNGLINRRPLLFLPLFYSRNPEIALTGFYIYNRINEHILKPDDAEQISAAIRKAFNHNDTRVRYAAIESLAKKRWLITDDIRCGLNDHDETVRNITACHINKLFENLSSYDFDMPIENITVAEKVRITKIKRELAPILLEHLNDTSFYVRAQCSFMFRDLVNPHFKKQCDSERFDWIRSDWHSRNEIQNQWKAWWMKQGENTLHQMRSSNS